MKTVFFGPFVGEFGWELLYWQGWVLKVCRDEYKDYRKIASSFPGREAFYPKVDEFWPHPDEISDCKISQANYITDFWKNGLPKPAGGLIYPDFEPKINNLLGRYKKNLPPDTVYYIPFKNNFYGKDNIKFGVEYPEHPLSNQDFQTKSIPFRHQLLESITPTKKGGEAFEKIYQGNKKIIAIFPRCREVRRPDKNWMREKYDILIEKLQENYGNNYKIAILGEPGGAFYAEGVPENTLDLINVPKELRMDIQAAALKKTALSLGSMSGAILFALACGAPSVTWGYFEQMDRYYKENYLGTKLIYYPKMNASVKDIFNLCKVILDGKFSLFTKFIPFLNKINRAQRGLDKIKKMVK